MQRLDRFFKFQLKLHFTSEFFDGQYLELYNGVSVLPCENLH